MSHAASEKGHDTDILIVGAGPTGLALATMLRKAGHDPMVVERLGQGQGTSRAAVIHAHTLEMLEALGIGERLVAEGIKLERFSIRDRDRTLTRLRFDKLPTPYPCLLMLTQDRTERILREALAEAGGRVQWGTSVETLVESPGGVTASLLDKDGPRQVRARYVVGADGMQSAVRNAAGIGFTGSAYAESFVLADVEMDWPAGREEVMLFFSPAGLVVVAPLPEGRFRIVATMENAPARPGVEDIQALLDARGPQASRGRVKASHWSSRFRLHHRVADHYRSGRYLLVGDAAHVHSPAGGQGMNTGLVDAIVLGRLMAEVLSGREDEAYLDHYEALRRPAAQEVMALAGRLTSAAMISAPAKRWVRNLVLRTIGALPPVKRRIEMNLSGLSRRGATVIPGREAAGGERGERPPQRQLPARRRAIPRVPETIRKSPRTT